jgi:hypothetical protein
MSCQRRLSVRMSVLAVTGIASEVQPAPELSQRPEIAPGPLFEYTCCTQPFDRFE